MPDQQASDDAASQTITGLTTPASAGPGGAAGGASGPAGGATAPQADVAAPVVSGLAFVAEPRPRATKGAALQLTLSEPATVQVTVERLRAGRQHGTKCLAGRTGKRCVRATTVATFGAALGAGPQRIALARRQLVAGLVRVSVVATDAAGNRSAPVRVQRTLAR